MTVADTKGLEDLREVIQAYNDLTERLTHSQGALKREVLRLRGELSEKNRQLARKNRLEVLGEMAAAVAHEVRNPLGGIELYAGLIGREGADNGKITAYATRIHEAARGLSKIVGDILDFTKPITVRPRRVLLSRVADAALDLASAAIEAKAIVIERNGLEDERPVSADFNLLHRALLNIVLNAADAMSDRGTLTITVRPSLVAGAAAGSIAFADTGTGMPPENIDKVFDPFFTAKDSGTGLGLAMVSRIVAAHNGVVTAANGPQGGAVFTVTIPERDECSQGEGNSGRDSGS